MITIGITCFILTMVMSMQFKIVNETDITSIEVMREEELRTELGNWKEKLQEATTQYEEKEQKLAEYKEKEASDVESSELVKTELDQLQMSLGQTDVEGEGIVVTLKDPTNDEIENINASHLLEIVNALKLAGAEAISINDERIITMSEIVLINYSLITINQTRVLSPYVIKAIGNQSYLESTLLGNGGKVDDLKKAGYDVPIEKKNKVTINQYNRDMKMKYLK